jgi:hypothetical protein
MKVTHGPKRVTFAGHSVTRKVTKGYIGGYIEVTHEVTPRLQQGYTKVTTRLQQGYTRLHKRGYTNNVQSGQQGVSVG